ncbi:MAG: hypothetical protein ACKO5K_14680 [Armatimonadota bacterium]
MPKHRSIAAEARALAPGRSDKWAAPAELSGKRMLGAGQYSCIDIASEHCPTPSFLRRFPEYLENHPFDGVAIPVRVPEEWCAAQGLVDDSRYALHDLVFTGIPLDDRAVDGARRDLRAVRWAHCVDNRLWVTVRDGTASGDDDRKAPALTEADWSTVCANSALTAGLARDTGLLGLVVDTEMYTNYATGELYPFGRFDADTWRRRGAQWIAAVQKAFPSVSLLFFFSWGPEHEPGGWPEYQNLKPFMDGILSGLRAPASLIHGWESTFWYGGRRRMPGGEFRDYPGDRKTFRDTATMIRGWRTLSADPPKYDRFVRVGMGAWMESDPYNLYPGWPTGVMEELPWSNLSLTLAYSESTVWVFSGHTHYPQTRTERNPFLWSLANQTHARGAAHPVAFDERFDTDPTRRGWAFDFDMLDAGRVRNQGFLPVFTTEVLGATWDREARQLLVRGEWPGGSRQRPGHVFERQRRRYFRRIAPLRRGGGAELRCTVVAQTFAGNPEQAPSIGFFHHDRYLDDHSVSLRVAGPHHIALRIGHFGSFAEALLGQPSHGTTADAPLHLRLRVGAAGVVAERTDAAGKRVLATARLPWPAGFAPEGLDEAGVAYPDGDHVPARVDRAAVLRVARIVVDRRV